MKIFLGILAAVLFLAIIAVAAGPEIVERITFRKASPEEVAEYRDWQTKKIVLPPEALEVRPFAKETVAASRAFAEMCERDLDRAYGIESKDVWAQAAQTRVGKGAADWNALSADLAGLEPLLKSFETLVSRPDYEIACLPDSNHSQEVLADITALRICGRLLRMKALSLAHENRFGEALRCAEESVAATRTNRYDTYVTIAVAASYLSSAVVTWREVVMQCPDVSELRRSLIAQESLSRSLVSLPEGIPLLALDNIGFLRGRCRAAGNDRVVLQGNTGRDIYNQLGAKIARSVRPQALRGMGDAVPSGGHSRWSVQGYKERLVEPSLYKIASPGLGVVRKCVDKAANDFGQLRVETAKRIEGLEKGWASGRVAYLAPAPLPVSAAGQRAMPAGR